MNTPRTCALLAALLAPAAGFAQAAPAAAPLGEFTGTLSVAAGGAFVDGDRARYQRDVQQRKSGFLGVEELQLVRERAADILTIDARALRGNGDYRVDVRWEDPERAYVAFGAESYRVFYDGSGGFFPPTRLWIELYDDALHLDRGRIWFEAGVTRPDQPQFRFRYERRTREGQKDSTSWGDTNLVGAPFGARGIVPAFWDFDETRDIFTFDVSRTNEQDEWAAGARYERTELDTSRNMRRRPFEAADRIVTSKDQSTSDMFSLHGYVQRQLTEQITFSTGALVTRLDTDLAGSRIYGQSYDPVYDPVYPRRQQRDEGFLQLTGGSDLRQYIANFNIDYRPHQHWQIRPALRFERTRTENISEFIETNVAANLAAVLHEAEGRSRREWKEGTGSLEARYTGMPNWSYNLRGEWLVGTGNLNEHLAILDTGESTIDRDTDLERWTQKYAATANWYAQPGLTFAAQYYFRQRMNEFNTVRDRRPDRLTSADRYPGYITDQDFETHDFNVRATWRARPGMNLTTRYDYQRSFIRTTDAGLSAVVTSRYKSHVISQGVMLTPIPRMYVTASLNLVYDQIYTPASAFPFVANGDNNYFNGSLGAGYALRENTDLFFEYGHYRADNFVDNSAFTQPFGADERRHAASLTWVLRQSENLIYTMKYTFADYRDRAAGGHNDYDAHILYGKVQLRF